MLGKQTAVHCPDVEVSVHCSTNSVHLAHKEVVSVIQLVCPQPVIIYNLAASALHTEQGVEKMAQQIKS